MRLKAMPAWHARRSVVLKNKKQLAAAEANAAARELAELGRRREKRRRDAEREAGVALR